MSPRKRILLLILLMSFIVITVESITFGILYSTAFEEERLHMIESAKSQARLIEAIARFDEKVKKNSHEARQSTIHQIRDAHSKYRGFGKTGEFTLSTKENDQIIFLLNHRHYDLNNPKPVPWNSKLAEPMRRALSGKSGTVVGPDYRGKTVLAAYEPLAGLNMGIVSKIDLSEVRAPFLKAFLLSGFMAIVVIVSAAGIFFKITNPIIEGLNKTVDALEKTLNEVKTLRGILPICSFCKKIRNDKGYWDQVEVYIRDHTDVDFSHGVCPDCMEKHYPEIKRLKRMRNKPYQSDDPSTRIK